VTACGPRAPTRRTTRACPATRAGRSASSSSRRASTPSPTIARAGLQTPPEPVYTVRFAARELFGDGDHHVTLDVWERHLHPEES
jgi:nitrile hydratase